MNNPWLIVALALGCGSNGGSVDPDAGTDAGTDTGPADGGSDTGPADVGVDAPTDVGTDVGADVAPDVPIDAPTEEMVVELSFEDALPDFIEVGTCAGTPSQGYEPLGFPGNTFGPTFMRCETAQTITITLEDLPPHDSISVDFLFAAIDSLDGEGTPPAGDFFRIDLDGTTIFREAFANATPDQIQTYEPPVPEIVLSRRVDLGFSGPGSFFTDSAYDMSLDPQFDRIPHTASTAELVFSLEGVGVQSLDDESWAIDNVRVTTHRAE